LRLPRRTRATSLARVAIPALLAALILTGSAASVAAAQVKVTEEQVKRAIARGTQALLMSGDLRGSRGVGPSGLAVMALVNCGVSPENPRIKAAVEFIRQNASIQTRSQYAGSYIAGVVLMVLEMTGTQDAQLAKLMTQRLVKYQMIRGDWGDFSRTQFALLGLRSAERLGVKVPEVVWKRARRAVEQGQNRDGGWGYVRGNASYGSMTAAGISSLYISGAQLHKGTKRCGFHTVDKRLSDGLGWLGTNFSVSSNPPRRGSYLHYYLYGLERVGVLTGRRYIGKRDWYREGAAYLVRTQRGNGLWSGAQCSTAFAMLFLGKGSAPVLVQKLRHPADWNADPYDIPNLIEFVRESLGVQTSYQTITMNDKLEDMLGAPVLYLNGHDRIEFTQAFRLKLARFVDEGGFVFAFACCGRKHFDESLRAEFKAVFGSAPEKLPAGHPVYLAHHDLSARADHHILEGIQTGCRTSVFYSPKAVCCAWDGCRGAPAHATVAEPTARRLGENMVAYALGHKELRSKLARIEIAEDPKEEQKPLSGVLKLGQVFHEGGWNPFPRTVPNLSKALGEKTGTQTRLRMQRVVVGRDELFDHPLIYMTGAQKFSMLEDQLRLLRQYFAKGGFLLADPACGSKEFDRSFRDFVATLYPEKKLTPLPLDHRIFDTAYRIRKVKYKKPVLAEKPGLDTPVLEGLFVDGRLAIVYSPYNIGCELGGHNYRFSRGYMHDDAFRMALNILLYATTH